MTTIGKIDVFDETQESWETYVERVQHFFAANDVDDEHKVPTLLSLIGSKTYSLLKDLLLPEKPADKDFDEIVSTLQKHLNIKPLEIAERFRFYKRNQHEGESVLSYVAELRKLTTHCNFGSNLEETLRDRLVCGLSNEQIQKRLLAKSKLKFPKAVDIAVVMETATRDATEIHSELRQEKPLGLDKLTLNRPSNRLDNVPPTSVCYRCGANAHVASECRSKKEVCHKCGKRGHIQRVCCAPQTHGPGRPSLRSRYQKSNHAIEKEPDEYGDFLNNLEVHNVNKSSNDVIWVDVKVENQHKFLPNLVTILHPLNQMLESNYQWNWTYQCEEAFSQVKVMIASDSVLTHYDPDLPLQLACDASPVGIGAVLSHVMVDGTERPIAFALRSLSKAEWNYPQIDKEALATVWGVKIFHNYIFGRNFILLTDHEPLTSIFQPSKSLPVVTAARLQRYALFFAGHDYSIRYKNTKLHGNLLIY